jgi:uncharacterized RDD family membrane protein YckC
MSLVNRPKLQLIHLRLNAFCFDIVLIALLVQGINFTYINFLKTFFYLIPSHVQHELADKMGDVTLINSLLIYFSYFSLSYYLADGQSLGKMIFRLRVQNKNHEAPNLIQSILRPFGQILCLASNCTFFLIPFLRKDSLGITDWISGTTVVFETAIKAQTKAETLEQNLFDYAGLHGADAELIDLDSRRKNNEKKKDDTAA